MTLPKDPIRQWIIGVLIAIIGALSSVAYASVATRISTLETDGKSAVEARADIKIQLAVLQSTVNRMEAYIVHLDANQVEILKEIQILKDGQANQARQSSRTSAQSATDSRRWNTAMDQQQTPRTKKKD